MEFCERMPALVGSDGYPLSWRHYVYGMAYLGRARARTLLDMGDAARAGGSTNDSYDRWVSKREQAQKRG